MAGDWSDEQYVKELKSAFKQTDKSGKGTIGRKELAEVFQDLDGGTWSNEDLDDLFNAVDKSGTGLIKYDQFIDFVMELGMGEDSDEEQDEEFKDDDADEQLEKEPDIPAVDIDVQMKITLEDWVPIMRILMEESANEAREIFDEVAAKIVEDGGSTDQGLPLCELLGEIKIEVEDREALKLVKDAIDEAKRTKNKKPTSDVTEERTLRRAVHKVVRALDKLGRPAEEAQATINEDLVPLSKAEKNAIVEAKSESRLRAMVKKFMVEPPMLSASAGQNACAEMCKAAVNKIIAECNAAGTKFTDPEWNMRKNSNEVLYVDKEQPGYDCTVAPPAGYKRLSEIVKDKGGGAATGAMASLFGGFGGGGGRSKPDVKPVLFKGGVRPGDIVQGQIGTCFLLGALGAMVSNNPESIKNMFIKYDTTVGVYGMRFCVDGEWQYVIVDDYVAVDDYGEVLYAHSKDVEEVWCPLVEKAYCKLHTCYEMCDGGQSSEAIFTFFGGCSGKFKIKKAHKRDASIYFKILKQARERGWLLTSGFAARKGAARGAGKCGEAMLPGGLVGGHAYSVLKVVNACGNRLVCCRNPWGSGEWTGKWSDLNEYGEWTEEMKEATGYKGLDDGKFWMSIEDFVANSAGVEYARTFGPQWKKITHYARFQKGNLLAKAKEEYRGKKDDELSFSAGAQINVTTLDDDWWAGNIVGRKLKGFFPADAVELVDRPVARFDLTGTPKEGLEGPMTAVILLMQSNSSMKRKFKRRPDGLNYKDQSYGRIQLVVIGPDGSIACSKEGARRCVWQELKLPGGGLWRIYALSCDGKGSVFSVRTYIKDGEATLKEVKGAMVSEVNEAYSAN